MLEVPDLGVGLPVGYMTFVLGAYWKPGEVPNRLASREAGMGIWRLVGGR